MASAQHFWKLGETRSVKIHSAGFYWLSPVGSLGHHEKHTVRNEAMCNVVKYSSRLLGPEVQGYWRLAAGCLLAKTWTHRLFIGNDINT
jgi:hypothetical protein